MLALIGAPPVAWENVVGGFQSQFYFLIGLSLLAIGGLLLGRLFSLLWWTGLAAGALAVFSMGSGFLWAAAVMRCTRDPARLELAGPPAQAGSPALG